MFSKLSKKDQEILSKVDQLWSKLRENQAPSASVITTKKDSNNNYDFDVIICGGTLGIFIATTLQQKNYRVAVIERRILQGREQEWNISKAELETFVNLDLLTEAELAEVIFTEYNPARVSFHQGHELWVKDVLNIGVSPRLLIEKIKQKFLTLGGEILENTAFDSAIINENSVTIKTDKNSLNARLLIDSMGHFSPIAKQIRKGKKPDGVCLVVGTCGQGFAQNDTGDLIVTFTPIQNQCQYFWEAFPAKDGRTTYLFTYLDAHPDRISLTTLTQEYFRLLPEYQNIDLDEIDIKRFLCGFFPAYNPSPLKIPFNRVLAIGDSSGSQSPVSFGGFGALVRHLPRLTGAIDEALGTDSLQQADLALIQPYQPNISVTWLFQKTMSVAMDKPASPQQINDLMSGVFKVMDNLGDDVLKPFLQDVVQFSGLSKTLPLVNPLLVLPLLPQVGLPIFLDWFKHYLNLGIYSSLYPLAKSLQPWQDKMTVEQKYYYNRCLENWCWGAGLDYHQS